MVTSGHRTATAAGVSPAATVEVWDVFVRVFHWSLVGLFVFAYFTGEGWRRGHEFAGYAIAALVALRTVWGFVGPKFARFVGFVRPPAVVVGFLAATARMRARRYLGHNPAGGAMVVTLLIAIAVIAGSGYLMTTDAFWGVEWIEDLHLPWSTSPSR
jgi:cytochrome b